jgi:hypothetical protein
MNGYYERLEWLRDKLADDGEATWSRRLLEAERGAATSGEALSNTGVVLREILADGSVKNEEVRQAIRATLEEAAQLWGPGSR